MSLENKFLFLGKTFIGIFLIINLVNFFPLRFRDVFFYTTNITILLDTSTLLLLGLSIPKFIFLRKITLIQKLLSEKVDVLNHDIDKLEEKQILNSTISRYLSIFFLVITLIQPISLIFVLNRSDFFITNIINSKSRILELRKSQILEMQKTNTNNLSDDLMLEKEEKSNDMLDSLNRNYEFEINNLIKNNNYNKFREIKYIIRNIFMSLIWSFAFFKLSNVD